MGKKKRGERQKRDAPLTPPVSDVLLQALLEGTTITREQAMTLPAVSGAVDLISGAIASMPVRLYERQDNSVYELRDDVRVRLLNGDTGDTLDGYQLKKAMVADYLMGGGGYCFVKRRRNNVSGLFYVRGDAITVMTNAQPLFKDYTLMVNGQNYKPFEFVKILRNTTDGATGIGLTQEVGKALETAYKTILYQLNLMSAGGSKKGFLKSERKLGQEEINTLKAAWKNLYETGSDNVIVLNNGLDFKESTNTSVEMQINESRKTLMDEINALFHISDNFDLTFKLAIFPVIRAFETALNRDLLLEKEKPSMYFAFDTKEIVKASLKERYDAYKLAKDTGFLTTNEIRAQENLERIDGMDVVNVGLGAVLYDIISHQYYSPNTNTTATVGEDSTIEANNAPNTVQNGGDLTV